ncbi:MAG TPA: XRE family transcriptional regulator [bacterium]|nr:XRE family transcriptional regulator [bacterium]HOL47654.1 XRE family transcriptional regulator [bacterium]HPQ18412.1 XRE family transcriptional regulator [bacterium]
MELDFSILKSLRKLKKITLKDLAEGTGVSIQALTKLENNKTNPTLETIKSICNFLKIDVTSLIQWAEIGHPRRYNGEKVIKEDHTYYSFKVNNVIATFIEMQAGGKGVKTINHTLDYEACYVISGKVNVVINNEVYLLNTGEVLLFDCIYNHHYEAVEDSKFIVLVIPKKTEEVLRIANPFEPKKRKKRENKENNIEEKVEENKNE